jgi:sterol desaturase/sphingolipid hydroxylase (fatty acid hydroxylase superfamily)
MDHRDLLIPAVALILAAAAIEWAVSARQGRSRSVSLMLANGWVALVEQAAGLLVYTGLFGLYAALSTFVPWAWTTDHWLSWVGAFLLVDLAFYAYHRFSHGTALGWSVHAVHHQSPELNLPAALRNSPLGGALQFVFHLPLLVLGVPPLCWVVCKSIHPLLQLFLHTEHVQRVPLLEGWVNTPAAHRVHHGLQEAYQGRNLGGVLVVWDRLFGTWTVATERPRYGAGSTDLDPIRSQVRPLSALARAVVARGPRSLVGPPIAVAGQPRAPSDPRPGRLVGAAVHFSLGTVVLVGLGTGWVPVWVGLPLLLAGALTASRMLGMP